MKLAIKNLLLNTESIILQNNDFDEKNSISYKSGSFNNIFEVDMSVQLIVRIPKTILMKCEFENISKTLHFLQMQSFSFKIPHLISYDSSFQNILKHQYWIQTKIEGISLQIQNVSTVKSRLQLTNNIAICLTELFKIPFTCCGGSLIDNNNTSDDIGQPLFLNGSYVCSFKNSRYKCATNLYTFLQKRFLSIQQSTGNNDLIYKYFWKLALKLLSNINFLHSFSTNCLSHNDFFPRNIIVDLNNHSQIKGIIDWDYAQILPCELAWSFIPCWLWNHILPIKGYYSNDKYMESDLKMLQDSFLTQMNISIQYFSDTVDKMTSSGLFVLGNIALYGNEIKSVYKNDYFEHGIALLKQHGIFIECINEITLKKPKKQNLNKTS